MAGEEVRGIIVPVSVSDPDAICFVEMKSRIRLGVRAENCLQNVLVINFGARRPVLFLGYAQKLKT